jgi:hypothetical protein
MLKACNREITGLSQRNYRGVTEVLYLACRGSKERGA